MDHRLPGHRLASGEEQPTIGDEQRRGCGDVVRTAATFSMSGPDHADDQDS